MVKLNKYYLSILIKSTNEVFKIRYQHIGKLNLSEGTGYYKNVQCIMNKNNFDEIEKYNNRFNTISYSDKLYCNYGIMIVPALTILTTK